MRILSLLVFTALLSSRPACADTVVVTAAHMIDVVSGKRIDDPQVIVTDGRISAVGRRGDAVPADARRIDLGGRTILPGLIDMHVHLTSDPTISGDKTLEYTDNILDGGRCRKREADGRGRVHDGLQRWIL